MMPTPLSGIINICKPPQMTSSDVVIFLRRLLQTKAIGHTGTLDPDAAGVLPVTVGRATKLFDYLVEKEKQYIFEVLFGLETDTLDISGTVISSEDVTVSREAIERAIQSQIGTISQVPPAVSAIRIDGKRSYEMARDGKAKEPPAREVTIHALQILQFTPPNRVMFKANCSKGTFVRSIARDLGRSLGTTASVSFLLRSASGVFDLAGSHTLEELQQAAQEGRLADLVMPMDRALSFMEEIVLDENLSRLLTNGVRLDAKRVNSVPDSRFYRVTCQGRLLGIGAWRGDQLMLKTTLQTGE